MIGAQRKRAMESSLESILEKAFFVAGRGSWFRDSDDQNVLSAASDAQFVIDRLVENYPPTIISPGTTNQPEYILSINWSIAGYTSLKSVSLYFLGNGQCDLFWNEPQIEKMKKKRINVSRAVNSLVPNLIDVLKRNTPGFDYNQ